ncbi:MAG: FecR family protein [Candidatus Aenigmatarchaeota archaeon]
MGRVKYIAAGVIAVVAVILIVTFVLPLMSTSSPAVLIVDKQPVEMNSGSGYRQAQSGMQLSQGASVKTGAGGAAQIILFGSSVVRLAENTEIKLSELVSGDAKKFSLDQSAGRTWNKVTKLSGFSEYDVKTPNAVASVRGTAFATRASIKSIFDLTEGNLSVMADGKSANIGAGKSAEISDGTITINDVVIDDFISSNQEKDRQFLGDVREKLKNKYATYISIAKSQYKLTDTQVDEFINKYLSGAYTQEEIDAASAQFGGIKISI